MHTDIQLHNEDIQYNNAILMQRKSLKRPL